MTDVILGGNVLSDNTPDGDPILLGGNRLTKQPSGGGAGEVWSDWITLTDAQIKALPTTPFTLIPAPGAGRVALPSTAQVLITLSGDYTNVATQATLRVGTSVGLLLSPVFVAGNINDGSAPLRALSVLGLPFSEHTAVDGIFQATPNMSTVSELDNAPLLLWIDNLDDAFTSQGDFTGGDAANTLHIRVRSTIVTLPV